jgi:hypothetical protein
MPERPERELRLRNPDDKDPNKATYKVYSFGRLKGAIVPILEEDSEERWEAIALDGSATRWKYRNHARDFLCGFPVPPKDK